jgi:mannose-6-phosphate isomerase-like protein (cupin superfamily)
VDREQEDDRTMNDESVRSIVMTPEQIAALPRVPLGDLAGVENTVLWTDGTSVTGMLSVRAGHQLGRHTHRTHLHHMWVVDGEATIADRRVGPGAYITVPPGVEHDIDATTTDGVTVYYSYTQLPAQVPAQGS